MKAQHNNTLTGFVLATFISIGMVAQCIFIFHDMSYIVTEIPCMIVAYVVFMAWGKSVDNHPGLWD